MPALSAPDRAIWVTHPYTYSGYLYIDKPPIIFAARVNQTTFEYPIVEVTFDTVTTGAFGDIQIGQTVLFGTTAGADDLGRQRIRAAATSTLVKFGESSRNDHDGEVVLVDNAFITVIDDRRIWAVHPRYIKDPTPTQFKDYSIEVIDGGRNYAIERGPKANAGCFRAALVDPLTDLCTFQFDGSDSLSLSTGIAIDTYLWDVGDGTITVGTSADAAITATFPIGRRYVSLTVTDDDGNEHTAYVLVVALSMEDATWKPIQSFEVFEDRETETGKTMSFAVYENVSPSTYYDGVAVIYFEVERYGTTEGSLTGPASCEGVKFVGWLDIERESPEATFQGIQKGVEFRCISTAERLAKIVLLPQLWKRKSSPDEWDETDTADSQRFAWYLLNWHSTVLSIADFLLPGGFDSEWKRWATTAGDLWSQVAETARARAHKLTCDKRGILRFVGDVQIQDSADRTAVSITTIGAVDITAYGFERKRHPDLYWLDANAITIGTVKSLIAALFAVAPGDAPGQGASRSTWGNLIVDDQDQLNIWAGNEYARLSSPWLPLKVVLMHTGDIDLMPALQEWVTVTIPSSSNRRGRGLTSQRCLVTEVNTTHSNDFVHTKEVELTLWIEIAGYPATTRVVQSGGAGIPPTIYPGPVIYPGTPPNPLSGLAFTASPAGYALNLARTKIARTRNVGSGAATWEVLFTTTDFGSASYISDYAFDSWNPKNAMYVMSHHAATDELKIWYVTNLNAAVGGQTITLLRTQSITENGPGALASSINLQGGIYAVGEYHVPFGDNTFQFFARDSYAGAWRQVAPVINADIDPIANLGIALGYHATGASAGRIAISGPRIIYESTDQGHTFAGVVDYGIYQTAAVHYPYDHNPNDRILYVSVAAGSEPNTAARMKRRNEDNTWSDIAPYDGGAYARVSNAVLCHNSIHTYTQNRFILSVLAAASGVSYLWVSDDGGDSWIQRLALSGATSIGGWPNDPNILWINGDYRGTGGATKGIYWTNDRGLTVNNMIGDWETTIESGGTYSGVAKFTPVWVP